MMKMLHYLMGRHPYKSETIGAYPGSGNVYICRCGYVGQYAQTASG
jgi:hypothetical protein